VQIESKDDMKKRGLPSPDRADALMVHPAGPPRIAALADLSATGNALIKRGVASAPPTCGARASTVTINDDGATGQDVNAVWQAVLGRPSNRRAFTSSEAQVRYERKLATGGKRSGRSPPTR
jgi:hypothetical protein